jgi:hypothetical protein
MKNRILIICLLCFLSLISEARETKQFIVDYKIDTLTTPQLITYLQQINVENFYGKPVDSFLLAIPSNLYNLKVYGGSHSRWLSQRASEMVVDFTQDGHGPGAIIYVREYTHMNRYSPTATWNTNLFRQEKIYKIDIYKDQNTCINGSCK